jgi:thymidylate synthase ThyX
VLDLGEFSENEKAILSHYCTNLDKDIYGIINLPQVVCGALFSRYSRSSKSAREILLEEFIKQPEMNFEQIVQLKTDTQKQIDAIQKAEEFYNRVLIGYGDDSVAELGGAHLAIENISNLATKFIEDRRIGLSPLEKSTRYVFFDKKNKEGEYNYYKGKELMESKISSAYKRTCDNLFDTYSKWIKEVYQKLTEKYPKKEDVSQRAYESTIKAKTCDILRGLLPASTLTNMGLYGNGRAYEYLLLKMYSSDLPEINNIANQMYEELKKMIPSFVKRVHTEHGQKMINYFKSTNPTKFIPKRYLNEKKDLQIEQVKLIEYEKNAKEKIFWAILFEGGIEPNKALDIAKETTDEEKLQIIKEYIGKRENRRHKPGRAFELAYYTFAICANFAQYRDLQRHRILTQNRQLLDCSKGFDIPQELEEFGFKEEFKQMMKEAKETHQLIENELGPELAQYVVPMSYKICWYMHLNLRELFHLIELRSSIQGHKDYRKLVLEIYDHIKKIEPELAESMNFVNREEIELERLEAEKRIDKKLQNLKKEL